MMSLFTKHKKVVVREEGAARRDWPFTLKYYLDMMWILKFLSPFCQIVRHKRQKVQFSYRVVVNSGQRGDDWGRMALVKHDETKKSSYYDFVTRCFMTICYCMA